MKDKANRSPLWQHFSLILLVCLSLLSTLSSPAKRTKNSMLGCGVDTFTYNLPCKVAYIHPEKKGKAILVVWLHGGVHVQKLHDLRSKNHLDFCAADDSILHYLDKKGIKAVYLMPVCYKANLPKLLTWKDCADDIKCMIDAYVQQGIVDKKRIYLTGSSDGGTGTWDLAERFGNVFAAGLALSCDVAYKVSIPMFWHSTKDDGEYSQLAQELKAKGVRLEYQYHPNYEHGRDEQICTTAFLDKFFAITK